MGAPSKGRSPSTVVLHPRVVRLTAGFDLEMVVSCHWVSQGAVEVFGDLWSQPKRTAIGLVGSLVPVSSLVYLQCNHTPGDIR